MNLISGKAFQANTICLPFDEKPNEKYLGDDVTVAGWGYTEQGKLLHWWIKNYVINILMIKKLLIIIWKLIKNLVSESNPANQLQKLVTKVMPIAKCQQAHADSGSPVLEANNVCAGGEEGIIKCFLRNAVFFSFSTWWMNFNVDSS